MNSTSVNRGLERLRIFGVIAGFTLASTVSDNPLSQLSVLQVCIVASIAGLTGIEVSSLPEAPRKSPAMVRVVRISDGQG
jgi:hypothetical protein